MRFGTAQTRDDDDALIRGTGRFAGDVEAEGALWLHVLRSPHAAGTIRSLDTTAARSMPGVVAVLTDDDQQQAGLKPFALRYTPGGKPVDATPFLPLGRGSVRWVGEPVAAVVAENRSAAEDAAEAIALDIEAAPAVTDARRGAEPDSPNVWADRSSNTAFVHEMGDEDAYASALSEAAHVIRAELNITTVTAATIEPRNSLALPLEGGRLGLVTGTQAPHRVKAELAHVLGLPPEAVRIEARHTGGSFGMRNGAYPEDALVLWAAQTTGRPVRWQASRSDAFTSDCRSRGQSLRVTLALDPDARFLALGVDGYAPLGAQLGAMTMHPMTANLPGLAGVYRTPVIRVTMRGVHANTVHMAPYRGAGRPEAIYVIERIIDIAARQLALDPVDLRRRNMIAPDQMPFDTPLGYTYDSGDFPKAMQTALDAADWDGFAARRDRSAQNGMLRGIGLACAIEPAGGGPKGAQLPEFGAISLSPRDGLTLATGSGDSGQGHATAFRQIAERLLGWDGPSTVVAGDTDRVAKGSGTFGSRTMGAVGAALSVSADKIIEQALPLAAEALEAARGDCRFESGAFRVAGTDLSITLRALVETHGFEARADAFVSTDAGTFPNGAHVAEIEIDPETGTLTLVAYTVADDVGTVINPLLLEGQIHGGIAQGLGQAFMEAIVLDPGNGALLTGSFMDYTMPRAADFPMFSVHHAPTPTTANPIGAKGAGESGTVGALAAGMNAVCDALASIGVSDVDMPATPFKLWSAIQATRTAKETP